MRPVFINTWCGSSMVPMEPMVCTLTFSAVPLVACLAVSLSVAAETTSRSSKDISRLSLSRTLSWRSFGAKASVCTRTGSTSSWPSS